MSKWRCLIMDLNQMSPAQIALVVLLTGMVITFVMLIILTFLIKIYGAIVYNAQNKSRQESKKEEPSQAPAAAPVAAAVTAAAPVSVPAVEGGIPQEVVAAIAAAVYTTTCGTHVVKSVRRAASPVSSRSVWAAAGLLESTRPF